MDVLVLGWPETPTGIIDGRTAVGWTGKQRINAVADWIGGDNATAVGWNSAKKLITITSITLMEFLV